MHGQLVYVVRVVIVRVLEIGRHEKSKFARGRVQVEAILVVAVGYRIDEGIAVGIRAVHLNGKGCVLGYHCGCGRGDDRRIVLVDVDHGDREVLCGVELAVCDLHGQLIDVVRVVIERILEVGRGEECECSRGGVHVEAVLVVAIGYRVDEGIAVGVRPVQVHREDCVLRN